MQKKENTKLYYSSTSANRTCIKLAEIYAIFNRYILRYIKNGILQQNQAKNLNKTNSKTNMNE